MNFPLPAILAFAAVTGLASASVVNIDFGSSTVVNVYAGQAAAPDPAGGATATWNPLVQVAGTASSVDLKDSTNANTGIGFSISGVGSTSNALTEAERSGGYVSLMRDYIQVDSANSTTVATATGTFTGLVVGATYDIYFYGQGESMSTTTGAGGFRGLNSYFEVNGVGKQTGWDGVAGGNGLLVEGIEYVKYTVVIGAGGNLVFDFENVVPGGNVVTDLAPTTTGGGARRGVLNAIQLVQVVPEPSTALLGMIGMLGLLVRRRR
jgi:PEP-CTERM motif